MKVKRSHSKRIAAFEYYFSKPISASVLLLISSKVGILFVSNATVMILVNN